MAKDIASLLAEAMKREKLYMKPHLTLGELAERLGTNRTYLSRYFNQSQHKTFFEYINAMRIKIAVDMLERTNYTLDVVAEKSGFNSLSTFRRAFVSTYDMSPSVYRRQNKKKGKS